MTEHPVDSYARQVVAGELPAGKYHRLACARHLKDRARDGFAFVFRPDLADRFFRFAGELKHYKGKQWARKPIELSPVQRFRLGSIFGWVNRSTGLRRFTTSYHELPRKSGKSLEAAVVALYLTFFDGEDGAEGYCIATKRRQAKIVFDDARKLVRSSNLRSRITVYTNNLHRDTFSQKLEPLGADADSTDGLNPHLVVVDEFHAMKERSLVDVMESATGARLQPHMFEITTAGDDPVSPCGDQHDYACKILDGVIEDAATDAFFAFIAHADPEDDWLAEETWRKANPHYGISVNPDDIRKLALKAKNMPSAVAEFKQKRLNIWINSSTPWLSLEGWRAGQTRDVPREVFAEQLNGARCYAGIDLSSKIDMTTVGLLFPPAGDRLRWAVILHTFTPADTLTARARRDRAPYQTWVDQGWMTATPGSRISQQAIRDLLLELKAAYDLRQIGIDPWNAGSLFEDLATDGFADEQVVEIPQTFSQMSAPAKDVEGDVLEGLVDAGGNPVLQWMVANAVKDTDGKDNIQPTKKKSRGRIDGVISLVIGRKLATMDRQAGTPAIFTDGILVLG